MKTYTTLERPRGDRDNAVGLLRFVLTSTVVLSHSLRMHGLSISHDPMIKLTSGQYTMGGMAVDAFFVLSGFLVAASWAGSRGWGDFLTRRATRIYPAFFAAVAFTSLVAAPWLAARGIRRPPEATFAGLAIPALWLDFRELGVNGSLWTIRYDFYYYLFIGMVGAAGLLRRRWSVAAMWLAAWGVYIASITLGVQAGIEGQHPRLLTCFLSGTVAYALRDKIRVSWGWMAVSFAALAWLGGAMVSYQTWPYRVMNLAFPVFGAYALLFAAFRPGARAAKLNWTGDYSYGLYLYAYPIQLMIMVAFRPHLNVVTHFLISWAVALVFAGVSLRLIERPFMKLRLKPAVAQRPVVPRPHIMVGDEATTAVSAKA
ncbi:acyltransferase family protein [Paludisphaera rhizosphaerae]|uniref:acyltransferase family protein n=1 Tax=Paludisphaera rhizosphaerae TaxID=2711216 RepID=UPI0013E9A18E|nr:acyltransferase [Paludisphaera rhizosphaerae]